jgi:hypothetical protein
VEVARIYEDGLRTGNATFETGVPSWEQWDAAHLPIRLVAELDGKTAGWAALTPSSERCCYRGVAENSGNLDAPGRDLPGEQRERPAASGLRLSPRRRARAPRRAGQRMA